MGAPMDVLAYLLVLFLGGLLIGALARLALPGPDPMGLLATALIGIGGTMAAGAAIWLIFGERTGPGIFLSFLFAVVIVYLIRKSRGGSLTRPGAYRG